jgi:hypothetical protein
MSYHFVDVAAPLYLGPLFHCCIPAVPDDFLNVCPVKVLLATIPSTMQEWHSRWQFLLLSAAPYN